MADDEDKRNDDEKLPDGESDKTGGQKEDANSGKGKRRWNRHAHGCKCFRMKNNRQSCDFCILDNLYSSYRFEVDNVWKRSTLLTAFAGFVITGYAVLVSSIVSADDMGTWIMYNKIALVVIVLGLIYSAIWTMMGKASKGWQEVYQRKITKCERRCRIPIPFRLSKNKKRIHFCDMLLSTSAGRYSVSRLNIILGIVMFVFWVLAFLFHISMLSGYNGGNWRMELETFVTAENLVCYLLIAFLAIVAIISSCKSSSLGRK